MFENELGSKNKGSKKLRKGLLAGALCLTATSVFATGCGSSTTTSSILNNVTLKTYQQGTDQWIQMTATLSTAGYTLGAVNIPIVNPANPAVEYGQITLAPDLCGTGCNGGDLTLAFNITQGAHGQSVSPLLPNGTAIPVGGLQNATVLAFNVGNFGAKVYFAFGQGVALLGTAIPFAALDPAGQYVPGLDVFAPITISNITADVGIFAGSQPNTTGVGLFVDLSSVVTTTPALASLTSNGLLQAHHIGQGEAAPFQSSVVMQTLRGSAQQESYLYNEVVKLSQKGTHLVIQ